MREKRLYNTAEAAEAVSLTSEHLLELRKQGHLPSAIPLSDKERCKWRWDLDELTEDIKKFREKFRLGEIEQPEKEEDVRPDPDQT